MENDPFEKLAARFVHAVSTVVPDRFKSLVFSSPLCARDPDVCLLWHAGYRQRHRWRMLIQLCFSTARSLAKGIVKILGRREPFGYAVYGKVNDAILVLNSACGLMAPDGEYRTDYVASDKDDAMFVFGLMRECGRSARKIRAASAKEKALIAVSLAKNGIGVFLKMDGNLLDKTLLVLEWLSWVLGLQWLGNLYLEQVLSETVSRHHIKKIGCIHEMHSYSRIVWRVASRFGLDSFTVQHASLSQGKRWYFLHTEEISAGLALPDLFYVFDQKIAELLKPYFKNTRFTLGCSCRYRQWIDAKPLKADAEGYCLFVTGIAGFDNEVVIGSLRNMLSRSRLKIPVRLRLHSRAELSQQMRRWIRFQAKKGKIELSKDVPLARDIEGSRCVTGMSSTVLEEALLLGRPVIKLTHPDYLSYINLDGIAGAKDIDCRDLSPELLCRMNIETDSLEMRKRLGLGQPVVTFERLFRAC